MSLPLRCHNPSCTPQFIRPSPSNRRERRASLCPEDPTVRIWRRTGKMRQERREETEASEEGSGSPCLRAMPRSASAWPTHSVARLPALQPRLTHKLPTSPLPRPNAEWLSRASSPPSPPTVQSHPEEKAAEGALRVSEQKQFSANPIVSSKAGGACKQPRKRWVGGDNQHHPTSSLTYREMPVPLHAKQN